MSAERNEPSFARLLPALILFALVVALSQQALNQFSVVQEAARAQLGFNDIQLSLIQGLGAAIPMVVLSIPIGILVDRTNRIRLMIVLAGIWTLGTLGTAFATDFTTLTIARMAAGVGATSAATCAISLAADLCAPAQRGRSMLILTLGKSAGIAAALGIGGWLLGVFTPNGLWGMAAWRGVHIVLAIASAAVVVALLFLREPARREVVAGPNAPLKTIFLELWQRRSFLIPLFVGQIGVVMADASAVFLTSPVLERSYGVRPEQATWVGGVLFVTGVLGSIAGGAMADIGHKSGRRGGILIGAVAMAGLAIPAALYPLAPGVNLFGAGLGLLMFCGTITGLITAVVLTVLLPNEMRGLCIGAFLALAGLIGFGFAPVLVAWLGTLLGGPQHLGTALAIVGVIVSTLAFFAFIIAMRRAPLSATEEPV
ncbi:MAG: MFS transporter [Pseudomonadota bacterium]